MAQDDHVGVRRDDLDRVLEGLAFGDRAELSRGLGSKNLAAESEHGRLKAQAGARTGLVKEAGHDTTPELVVAAAAYHLFHRRSHAEHLFQEGPVKLLALHAVTQVESLPGCQGHKKI